MLGKGPLLTIQAHAELGVTIVLLISLHRRLQTLICNIADV